MRISDWSSDVCSSDLQCLTHAYPVPAYQRGGVPAQGGNHHVQQTEGDQRALHGGQQGVLVDGAVGIDAGHQVVDKGQGGQERSEEPTSELQSLMRTSYAVFCLPQQSKSRYTTK